jgi:hypothetical protein
MFVVFDNERRDEADICDSLDEVKRVIEERRDNDGDYFDNYVAPRIEVYKLGERVPFTLVPAQFKLGDPNSTEIPAPLPGETVSDYARRITGA